MTRAMLLGGGALLVLAGFLDVFWAVLHYDRHGPVSTAVNRGVWGAVRLVARSLPRRRADAVRSFGLPLMAVTTVVTWVFLFVFGFALVVYDGFRAGAFELSEGTEPTFATAFYTSATTISTLGYGDVTPTTFLYQAAAVVEALTGFAILTLTLSYLISVYQVLQGLNMLAASLQHQSDTPDEVAAILGAHFPDGEPRELSTRLHELHNAMLAYYEGLHRYPLIYYFCSTRPFASMPYTFLLIGELLGALRWGLPTGHPVSCDPWLLACLQDYQRILAYVGEEFGVAADPEDRAEPPTLTGAEFALELRQERPGEQDRGVARFLHVDDSMRRVVRVDHAADPADLYARYRGWLEFARPTAAFVREASQDLGGDIAIQQADHDRLLP